MYWRDAVLDAIERQCKAKNNDLFTRQDLIKYELDQIIKDTSSRGVTPEQTLNRVLQDLRDANEVEFVDNDGTYRWLKM
ncbi:MAG: hypothetical protein ACYSSP_02900 [Planctomycetota bacterium]|jgi:hypothetical protein